MKKTVLTAINAKYIHSNLAVYSLRAYAARYADCIELAEFTINQQKDYILQEIYRKKPDILAFSCYIWNMEYVLDIMENVHLVLPDVQIWLGGPEVSFDCRERMEAHPEITGIMRGEGEKDISSADGILSGAKGQSGRDCRARLPRWRKYHRESDAGIG